MQLQDALTMYKLPYAITNTINAGGFTSFELTAVAGGATVAKLQTRLTDLKKATGLKLEIIDTETGLYLRSRNNERKFYDYFDYNGYIDPNNKEVPFIIGFNANGGVVLDNLDNARHLLVAGTTGSGKSVFLHDLVYTFCENPNIDVYLVDVKKVELSVYAPCAHIATDVFGELSAGRFTAYFLEEIERRYTEMQQLRIRDFKDYQKLYPDMHRKVLVIDELADLLTDKNAKKALVPRLLRIAQIGRAAGIHLVLATQRPDVSVIDGTLKGNLPTRVCFKTISSIDSRVVLDHGGAEKLTGYGDGLYLKNEAQSLERIQAPYIDFDIICDKVDEVRAATA